MEVDIRILLKTDAGEPFMGIGQVWLLQGIERTRSIAEAAREMDLSYPKALRMLKNVERGLGAPAVVRHKGGAGHGGAELTALGQDFLRRYDRIHARIIRYAERLVRVEFASAAPTGGGVS